MLLGSKYLHIGTGELPNTPVKCFTVKLLFISFTIQIEHSYIMYSISLFDKFDINLTFIIH